ncbi:aminotransferase class I/II-fold pyridoxal phosphate-dependent enzyme [Parahaliea sp. F7430]|uniref:Aminotransferase class I/II-fold pyridoxal phosphate-dependent enzyme n=1 Tax=Sediminihaliea albiluteola TaxID=2758564 RepID=A0A7W2TXP5_9GAMM|nr:pyridoxal-dependent decarboxylase [Sediminihaliea albiluteola]MBA6413729.1 aminotransferase class I/II-fold pyridoxal phosphate-dependent enzyme [Sediminihaliea albiluteola]
MSNTLLDLDAPSLLDPEDWADFRAQAHAALDTALEFIEQRQQGAVWQELPSSVTALDQPLPRKGAPLDSLVSDVQKKIMPYTLGNTHPRFWGWVHGSGTPSGLVAQMMMAAINANMGGREHAPIYVERQVIRWLVELFALPEGASGVICTGTSTATLLGLSVARHKKVGQVLRSAGNAAMPGLRAYASGQVHVSVSKALELMGLGTEALCAVPVASNYSMDVNALEAQLQADIAEGLEPFVVVSCVGSVNSGAIDDLQAINRLCRKYGVWHHVDGAFGALSILSESLRPRIAGIEEADSIAFDFHKWMHVGYAAGCLLVADGEQHRATFATSQAYLKAESQGERVGMSGGAPWPTDFGVELSRGFSALAVWFQLREMGTERLGRAIYRNCLQASKLAEAVTEQPELQLLAPVSLNIVCFRYAPQFLSEEALNDLNRRIVIELQCRGIAAPSSTVLDGRTVIRVAITNHRTRWSDLQALLNETLALGAELQADAGLTSSVLSANF